MSQRFAKRTILAVVATSVLCILANRAYSQTTYTWTNSSSGGIWSDPANWLNNNVADGADNTANFSTLDLTANNTVTMDSSHTLGFLTFADATPSNDWIVSGANVLTLQTTLPNTTPTITVTNRTATIQDAVAGSQGFIKNGAGTLVLNTTAGTWTGNAVVNAGSLTIGSGITGLAGFILNNGTTLTTSQSLGAGNVITALAGTATVATTGTLGNVFNPTFAGNGNINMNFSALLNTTSVNMLSEYGGVFSLGAQTTNDRIAQDTTSANFLAQFATLDLGTSSGSISVRNAGDNVELGGLLGGASTALNGGGAVFTIGSANTNTTFAGRILATASFTKAGTGTLTLTDASGSAFTAVGAIGVNGGTLKVDYSTAPTGVFGAGSPLNIGGGTLYLQGKSSGATTQTFGNLTLTGIGGSGLVLDTNGGTSLGLTLGQITATANGGSLNISTPGSGAATITTPSIKAADGTFGGRITMATDWATGGGTANTNVTWTTGANTISLAGQANGNTVTFSGTAPAGLTAGTTYYVVGATGTTFQVATAPGGTAIALTNSGTTATVNTQGALAPYSSYAALGTSGTTDTTNALLTDSAALAAGPITQTTNSLKITTTQAGQSFTIGAGNALVLTNGGLLFTGANDYSINGGTIRSATATNSDLIVQQLGNGNLTIGSVIANTTGASILTKAGPGTLTLTGSNTYTGLTSINGGVLSISSNANLGAEATGATLSLNGGTLRATSTFTLENSGSPGSNKRGIQIVGGGGAIDVSGSNNLTVSGVVSEFNLFQLGSLKKTGTGTLTLSGLNTYSGATVISGGTLSISSLANAGVIAASGSGKTTTNGSATVSILNTTGISVGQSVIGNAIPAGTTVTAVNPNVSVTISANATGSSASPLTFFTPNSLGSSPNVAPALIFDGGTLQYTGPAASTDRTFTLTSNGGTIDGSGTGSVIFSNLAPVVADNALAGSGARLMTLTGSTASNTFAGQFANGTGGATSLTKSGTGSWILTNPSHAYTGNTTITSGALLLSAISSNPIASSANLKVNSSSILDVTGLTGGNITLGTQTLSGAGTVLGRVTTSAGTHVAPGDNAVGTLNVGSFASNSGSIFDYDFANTGNTPSGNDRLAVGTAGGLTLNGGTFNLFSAGSSIVPYTTNGTFTLITYSGSDTLGGAINSILNVGNPQNGLTYTFADTGTAITLNISGTAVPFSNWVFDGSSTWNTLGNWNNGTPPNGQGQTASFGGAAATHANLARTVTLDGSKTVGVMIFAAPNGESYTITQGSGGSVTLDNGALAGQFTVTNGVHSVAAPVVLASDAAVLVTNSGDSLALSGAVSGAHTITKTGAGTLALNSANTYGPAAGTVGTTLSAGTLQVGNNLALSAGDLAVSTSTLKAGANNLNLANNVSVPMGNTLTVDTQANTMTLSGSVVGDGNLTKSGSGTLIIAADNTNLTGTTTINAGGTLQLGTGGVGGSVGGPIVDNGILRLNRSDDLSLPGTISGSGQLIKDGTNNLTLLSGSTYNGDTSIVGGILTIGAAQSLQNSTLNYNNLGGTLSFGTLTAASIGQLKGAQNLALVNTAAGGVTLTLGSNNQTATYTGALSGIGGVVKTGVGSLTLTGANTYTGSTVVQNGTFSLGGTSNLTGQFEVRADLGGTTVNVQDSAIVNSTAALLIAANPSATFNSAAGLIVKNNAQVTAASLSFGGGNGRVPNGTFVTVQDAASMTINGSFNLQDSINGTGVADNNTLNLNGGTLGVNNFIVTNTGNAKTSVINFNGGTLKANVDESSLGGVQFLPALTTLTATIRAGGAILNTNGNNATIAATLTHDAALGATPDGGLIKLGSGTLSLTANNTYTGNTTVNVGSLNLNNSAGSATGTSAVNVNSGGGLGGTGSTGSAVTVNSGGNISPGNADSNNGIGTLTFNGPLSIAGGSILNFDLQSSAGPNDLINVTTTDALTLNGASVKVLQAGTNTAFTTNGVYNLIGYSGTIGGTGPGTLSVLNPDPSRSYTFGTAGNFVTLTILPNSANSIFWNVDANGSWGTGTNWTGNAAPNAPGVLASFGGGGATLTASRTITLNAPEIVGALVFNNSAFPTFTYTVAGTGANALTLDGNSNTAVINNAAGNNTISAPINLSSDTLINVAVPTDNFTVSGKISGSATTFSKSGLGALTLTNANDYSATNTFNAGTVILSGIAKLGSTSNNLNMNGGTLDLGSTSQTVSTLNYAGGDILHGTLTAASGVTFTGSGTSTLSSALLGFSGVNVNGSSSGKLILSGANSYSGGTTINSGTLSISSDTNLGDVSGAINLNGGTFQVTGTTMHNFNAARSAFSYASAIDIADPLNNFTISPGGGSNGATLVKLGAGTLVMANANGPNFYLSTVSGSVRGGTLEVASQLFLGTTVQTATTQPAPPGIEIAPGAGQTAAVVVDSGADLEADRIVVGGNQANSAGGTGTLTVNGGTINSAQWFTVGSFASVATTSTATLNGASIVNVNSAGTTTVNTRVEVADFGPAGGVLNINGTSQLNIYNNGDLALGVQNNGSGAGTVNQNGGTVTFYSDQGFTPGSTLATPSGLRIGLGTGLTGTAYTYNLNGGQLLVPVITGTSGNRIFNFNGGTLVPTADNTNYISGLTSAQVQAGGAIINTSGVNNNPVNVTIAQALVHDATVGAPAIDGGLKVNGTGSLTLSGASTFTGNTTLGAGSNLILTNSLALQNSKLATIPVGGTTGLQFSSTVATHAFTVGGFATNTNFLMQDNAGNPLLLSVGGSATVGVNSTYGGALSGTGSSLTKVGSGTLTLTGTNTYTGATTVNAGTLLVNGTHVGGATYTVNTGGTLGGTGTIPEAITVATGGTLSPGAGIGTPLHTTGAVSITGVLKTELQGSLSDVLDSTGTLALNAGSTANFTLLQNLTTTHFVFANYAGALGGAGTFANITFSPGAGIPTPTGATLDYTGGHVALNVSPQSLRGNFNLDNTVTASDVPAMLAALTDLTAYKTNHPGITDTDLLALGDFDNSGTLTNLDIQGMLDYMGALGAGAGGVAAVPEPATWLLLGVGGALVLARRRRRAGHGC